jgi:hypothetical protein
MQARLSHNTHYEVPIQDLGKWGTGGAAIMAANTVKPSLPPAGRGDVSQRLYLPAKRAGDSLASMTNNSNFSLERLAEQHTEIAARIESNAPVPAIRRDQADVADRSFDGLEEKRTFF